MRPGKKTRPDNFMRALLTQVVVADNELEDYTPKYGNPAINFATDDMGSDKAWEIGRASCRERV
mgnify:CR=1 FL=1